MRFSKNGGSPLSIKLATLGGLLFLHVPFGFILLYAFSTEDKSYQFPPPGLTTKWFAVAWGREDIWEALTLSVKVALVSTSVALVLGTLAAAAIYRTRFFGREAVSLLIILPIALPQEQVDLLMDDAERGANAVVSVDLEKQEITGPDGGTLSFEVDPWRKHCLLNGLDDIGLTLEKGVKIDAFEEKRRQAQPWL